MARHRRYDDILDEDLQAPTEAAGYLNACLESGEPEVFLLALRGASQPRSPPGCAGLSSGHHPEGGKLGHGRSAPGLERVPQAGLRLLFDPSRSAEVPKRLFEGFQGVLQTDGYEGNGGSAASRVIVHVG